MTKVTRAVETLGDYLSLVESALDKLDSDDVVSRIWGGDHRVWSEDPTEIEDRLGWLTLPQDMVKQIPLLAGFGSEIRQSGFTNIVLLGMGGSSLGPEVLRRTLGSAPDFPQLRVLDSTLPSWIISANEAIDPSRTLFLVSSKSGTTIESNTLYSYFRQCVADGLGESDAGDRFVAVTDPGTPLEILGSRDGFRRVFINPPNIGGRYSVLSCFGMLPAALLGLDLEDFLGRTAVMQQDCRVANAGANPGARLGAIMASLAQHGRDKLTLITSPALASFGLWVEQMLAESLGKSGRGIVPVAGEPTLSLEQYSNDRLIVYLRLQGDDNSGPDALVKDLSSAHPSMRLELADRADLGAEFYRWEFATAVAGCILGVHPFDQPNVQGAKDKTDLVLKHLAETGELPCLQATESVESLMSKARAGDYLAILSYLPDTGEVHRAMAHLRQRLSEKYGIPTTAGFGPRYLHSTGQLHKGGPISGIFLQFTTDHPKDIAVPNRPYSFGSLADAQSTGDLQALLELGRRAGRIQLGPDPAACILELAAQI